MSRKLKLFPLFLFGISSTFAQNWVQIGSDINGDAAGDQCGFGISLSADGNTAAVGSPYNDVSGTNAGQVRIFRWSGSAWLQMGADLKGEKASDYFGNRVSISSDGNTVAIGGFLNDGKANDAGHVRVFSWNGTGWSQKGADIDGEAAGDNSGYGVSLSSDGNGVAIGAILNDGNGTDAGQVRVYSWSGSAWSQKGSDIDGEAAGDQFGARVSLSSDGNTIASGSHLSDASGKDAGQIRVFTWNGSAWAQKGMDMDGEAAGDNTGVGLSLSSDGNTVAMGGNRNDANGTDAGHTRVYSWNGSAWSQKGTDIDGKSAGDVSGSSVGISSDGNTLVIGSSYSNGNGVKSGQARVFKWDGTKWLQDGVDINGVAAGDEAGSKVAMSADGNNIAITALFNDGNGKDAGHLRIYRFGGLSGIKPEVNKAFRLYPNPSTNSFTLNFGQIQQEIRLVITDVTGKVVSVENFAFSDNVEFNIEGKAGVYFVNINTLKGHLFTVKVIKE